MTVFLVIECIHGYSTEAADTMITVFEETSKAVLGWFISYFKGIYNIRSHTPEYFTHLKIFDNYGIDNG